MNAAAPPGFASVRPWLAAGLALGIWITALTVMVTARWQGDIAGFARFSTKWALAPDLPEIPRTRLGYDGQYYAGIATDPLFLDPRTSAELDNAPYRGGRILLPLTAWLVSFGNGALAVRVYVILCWVLGLAAVITLDRWQRAEGAAPEWGLVLFFAAGVVPSVTRALPDAAAAALVVLALRAHGRGRAGASLALNVCAVLCRETSFLVSLALAFIDLRARRLRPALLHLALPALVAGGWRLWLRFRIGPADLHPYDKVVDLPLSWLTWKMSSFAADTPIRQLADLLALTSIVLAVAAAVPLVRRWKRWQAAEATYVAFTGLALLLTVYIEPFTYSRVLIVLPLLALPLAARHAASGLAWLVRGSAILGAFAGVVMLWIELIPALRRLLE